VTTLDPSAPVSRAEAIAEVERVARETFGYDALRPGQGEAMASLVQGHDVLLVMPTGGGKSAVYQIPAVVLHGPTLVISPLIALQQDQVEGLMELGEDTVAHSISSAVSAKDRTAAWEAIESGEAEFLFLAPEQLANEETLERVRRLKPSVVAVDEAHSVSAWGHDFRPDYLRLGEFIDAIGHPRVIALTATAAPPVRADIVERLRMRNAEVVVRGFARPNIDLEVIRVMTDEDKKQAVLLRAMSEAKPCIVYTGTRKETEAYAEAIAELGMAAKAYHGGMRAKDRESVQQDFMEGRLDVIVATSAFGMGIDKADIRTVIHATVPDSPDSYYQEIGRAGRDGEPALGILYYRNEDLGLRRFFASSLPQVDDVASVAGAVRHAQGKVDRKALAESTGFGPRKLGRILNLLDELDDEGIPPQQAAERAVEIAQSRRKLEESRIEMMRGFAETTGCRRQFLMSYFGEVLEEPCGNCDTCRAGTADETPADDEVPWPVQSRVRHEEFGEGVVMGYDSDPDTVTVLFEESGYRTLAVEAVSAAGLLEPA
jgi:ATP-dependent DNA helicase RecQ